jgi:LysR family transcriptional regulator, glycine cleavage system transcriptional activator
LTAAFERLKASRGHITISITVPPAFADKWLLPRIESFATKHPLYDLRIDTSGRLVDFAAERMDVGIRCGSGRWPGLEPTFLLRDAFFPVCSPLLLEGAHPLRGPEDLKHHILIHDRSMAFESAFPTWRTWLQEAGFPDINTERGLQINDSAAAYQAAINGSGVVNGEDYTSRLRFASGPASSAPSAAQWTASLPTILSTRSKQAEILVLRSSRIGSALKRLRIERMSASDRLWDVVQRWGGEATGVIKLDYG